MIQANIYLNFNKVLRQVYLHPEDYFSMHRTLSIEKKQGRVKHNFL